jgi:hypothetical protein
MSCWISSGALTSSCNTEADGVRNYLTVCRSALRRTLNMFRIVPNVVMAAANSDRAIAAVRDGAANLGFIETPLDHTWARHARWLSVSELSRTPVVTREAGSGRVIPSTSPARRCLVLLNEPVVAALCAWSAPPRSQGW